MTAILSKCILKIERLVTVLAGGFLGKYLVKNAFFGISLQGVHVLLGFVNAILLAWVLGPYGLGIYSFAVVFAAILSLIASAGLSELLMRELAILDEHQNFARFKGLITFSNSFVLSMFILILFAAATICLIFQDVANNEYFLASAAALLLIPINSFNSLRAASLVSLRKFIQGQSPERVIRPFVFLILLACSYGIQPKLADPDHCCSSFSLFRPG